jgi:hypothetical protein
METEDSAFYTRNRWRNWIERVKESGFTLEDETGESGQVFINMEDDVILACLKIIAKYERGLLSAESAIEELLKVRDVILEEIESISEDIDLMLVSLQTSLMGVIAACECYIKGDYTDRPPAELISEAVSAEAAEDIPQALYSIAQIGARMIEGSLTLDDAEFENLPDGLVAEWFDGLESLNAAMLGSDSYKDDEEYIEE